MQRARKAEAYRVALNPRALPKTAPAALWRPGGSKMKRRRSSWATLGIVILGLILPLDAARAATIIKAKKGNGTIATALLIDLVPELILKQKTPNNTLATA